MATQAPGDRAVPAPIGLRAAADEAAFGRRPAQTSPRSIIQPSLPSPVLYPPSPSLLLPSSPFQRCIAMVRLASGLIPLSIAAVALADPIHVPLTRRNTGRRVKDASRYPAAGDFLRSKYGFETVASKLAKRGETVGIELTNQVSARSSCCVLWRDIVARRLLRGAGVACSGIRQCSVLYTDPSSRLPRRHLVRVCAQNVDCAA